MVVSFEMDWNSVAFCVGFVSVRKCRAEGGRLRNMTGKETIYRTVLQVQYVRWTGTV